MIKLEHTDVYGWEAAIRGMRNPKNSWDKSDSFVCKENGNREECRKCPHDNGQCPVYDYDDHFVVGDNDHELMMRLAKGGSVHAKYRRVIVVTVDITAPLYWWKEFDTYKVGTVANSCSTMHKIHAKEFTMDDFSHEKMTVISRFILQRVTITGLNYYRKKFCETKNKPMKDNSKRSSLMKKYWEQMIQLLPTSYNQKRTIMMNYEVLVGMYRDRKNHKLDEWHVLCDWIKSLPYSEIITGGDQ